MAERVVIMLLNANPDHPSTLGAPFFQACVAAAMDLDVQVHFATRTVQLLKRGYAEGLFPGRERSKSVYDFMREAHAAGARFYGCSQAMQEFCIDEANAIPEFDGARGGAAFLGAALDEDTLTLTY